MSTAVQPGLFDRIQAHREGKRVQIQDYFEDHLGEVMSSRAMHMKFGSSFRTRVSDINRDSKSPIRIENEVRFTENMEQSSYWSVRR